MTRLAKRARKGADRIAETDLGALRSRVQGIVEEAVDQVEHLLKEAPTAKDAREAAEHTAEKVRSSRAMETAVGLVAAGAPAAAHFARSQLNRRNARRASKAFPSVVRTHPLVIGAAVAASAIVGVELLRRRRSSGGGLLGRGNAKPATGLDLDEEVARMEGEGGDPGAHDGEPPRLDGYARAGNGHGSGTR